MNTNRIEELLANIADNELSPEDTGEILAVCKRDESVRKRLVRNIEVDRLVALALSDDGDAFAREFRSRLDPSSSGDEFSATVAGRLRKTKLVRLISLAAAAVIVLSVGLLFFDHDDYAVEIVRAEATDWEPASIELEVGQRIVFESGLVELRYLSGVSLVIEAPADFEVSGRNRGYLHRGKLVAEVDDALAHGFTIDGPSGRLVDLGTRFAVEVDGRGEMEVHVIEGKVDATATGGVTKRLVENQALRLANGRSARVEADARRFITRMPAYRNLPPRYIRWGFDDDDPDAGIARNSGRDLAPDSADAEFRSFSGEGSGPQRVSDAPFGEGLRFDGRDAFLETNYRGISGGSPRTVAFWLRVPEDSGRFEGYGIINWGNVRQVGGAWQISVNTASADGPVGRLRVGTHRGQVIGTTELRDGKWHHCSVVMYGDESGAPNTSTHILLYINGQLEPSARRSLRVVDTAAGPSVQHRSEEHGIWMGRNLGYIRPGHLPADRDGKFFRGDIDEMIICDTALDQRQLLRLMELNEMP